MKVCPYTIQNSAFMQFCNKFMHNFVKAYKLMFLLSSDTLHYHWLFGLLNLDLRFYLVLSYFLHRKSNNKKLKDSPIKL